jgi:hypothetical protein
MPQYRAAASVSTRGAKSEVRCVRWGDTVRRAGRRRNPRGRRAADLESLEIEIDSTCVELRHRGALLLRTLTGATAQTVRTAIDDPSRSGACSLVLRVRSMTMQLA